VPDTPPLVALTVDDGVSSPVVGAYVALARATGIRLTFFANGVNQSWAEHQRDMQPLVDSGQIQIANHSWATPTSAP
jgi:peptidoglycan-N-acetylglucosamine deacetylase